MVTDNLPDLVQLVQHLKKQNEEACSQNAWSSNPFLRIVKHHPDWSVPMKEFVNDVSDDKFVVVQTEKGRHTIKPNLSKRHFLYRGQNKHHKYILSSFLRDEVPDKSGKVDKQKVRDMHIVANLKTEEFMSLLRMHPLFMMLDRGICLEPERKPVFLNMNYYGLAQHYGFKTGLVDFTTDLDVAAFFACTKNVGYDEYRPVIDTKNYQIGVLYVHQIVPCQTFNNIGFSTIGLQLFPRSGAQKGILFNEEKNYDNLNNLVVPFLFRQDANVSRHYFRKMDGGRKLFPKDSISKYAKEILDRKEVPGCVFAENLYTNQDSLQQNLDALERMGMKVNWNVRPYLTDEMLGELESDLKNGLWEQFCRQIYFASDSKGEQMMDSLLQLPQNPVYAHYFRKDDYPRIVSNDYDMYRRAVRNKERKKK